MLETERLVLRKPMPADADGAYELISDPEVMRYIGRGETGDREVARTAVERWLERWERNGFGHFSVIRKEDERFLGRVGLLVWDAAIWTPADMSEAAEPTVELGWTLAREHWGHGYATEAAAGARDWAFAELPLDGLISIIHPENVRSIHVARRLGAVPDREIEISRGPAVVWRHPAGGQEPAR